MIASPQCWSSKVVLQRRASDFRVKELYHCSLSLSKYYPRAEPVSRRYVAFCTYTVDSCTISLSMYFDLANTQHPRQSTLLGRCNREAICILHGHPHLGVRAVIGNWCNNILSWIGPGQLERNSCLPNGGFQLSGP